MTKNQYIEVNGDSTPSQAATLLGLGQAHLPRCFQLIERNRPAGV